MQKEIWVVKEDGSKEKFDSKKVMRAVRRSGMSAKESEIVLKLLKPHLKSGITTKQIYSRVYGIIRQLRPEVTHRYNLKRALILLGPSGYDFEDFTGKLFECMGYKTEVRQIPIGKCVTHETDVIARKGKEKLMVECKFRNEPGTKCRIQTALYIYARFMDLRDGAKIYKKHPFTKPCLVTNARFSRDARDYAKCMGMRLIGWRYPFSESLEVLIDKTKCYPISVIKMIPHTLDILLKRGIVTVLDVPQNPKEFADRTGISLSNARRICKEAQMARK